jgi:hypothetical protein
MNHPYYTPDDQLGAADRNELWQKIQKELPSTPNLGTIHLHWKSFLYGNVAAAMLIFAALGVWSLLSGVPGSNQLSSELAYEQGMQLMMQSSAQIVAAAPQHKRELLEAKMMSIEDIDRAIEEIRNDMVMHGITPMNQRHLRSMYALKLDYLKELIITGDLES